jgi:hypothetical protein
MANLSPAEVMHNRILNGSSYSSRDVVPADFEAVARRSGTLELPAIKRALDRVREEYKDK